MATNFSENCVGVSLGLFNVNTQYLLRIQEKNDPKIPKWGNTNPLWVRELTRANGKISPTPISFFFALSKEV